MSILVDDEVIMIMMIFMNAEDVRGVLLSEIVVDSLKLNLILIKR